VLPHPAGHSLRGDAIDVTLIQVPYHAGDDRHGSSDGPRTLIEAGAVERLSAHGLQVTVDGVQRPEPFRDTAKSAGQVNEGLAAKVREATAAGRLPVVLTGSCNSCMGVVGGFDHAACGVVWLDAHADFNTPESTQTGFFPGMSAAVIAGHCYRDYWAQIGDSTPVAEESFVMFGIRDLWPEAERERLRRSGIHAVEWREGEPQADVVSPLDALAARVDEIYLHIDFDGFAPEVAPGVVDDPVPGGISFEQGETIVAETARRFRLRAVTLATFTPERDEDDKTLRLALRLIDLIGEHAARRTD
jgi:arginase